MRQFELIKRYPGSPELGIVVENPFDENYKGEYSEFWKEIKPEKELVFYSTDLNPIYKGDNYYAISVDKKYNEELFYKIKQFTADFLPKKYRLDYRILTFVEKKAAEQFLIMNKPCLSISDFVKANIGESTLSDTTIYRLKEMVKKHNEKEL